VPPLFIIDGSHPALERRAGDHAHDNFLWSAWPNTTSNIPRPGRKLTGTSARKGNVMPTYVALCNFTGQSLQNIKDKG
jgi:hypothetical protein